MIMANTYTQSYFHLVFAVKNRAALINKSWKSELEMYITGIIQNQKHKLLAIGSMPDHIHIFIGLLRCSVPAKAILECVSTNILGARQHNSTNI